MENFITATTQQRTTYGEGLYTVFSGELEVKKKLFDGEYGQFIGNWKPIKIKWVGIRATKESAYYIIKDCDNNNHYGITEFRVGKVSLKKYLHIKSMLKN